MRNRIKQSFAAAVTLVAALTAAGCKQQKITSYEIPKEDYSVKPFGMPKMASARPEIKFDAPKSWEKTPTQMGAGAFRVDGGDGKYADIKVIPLRAGPDTEAQSVNMWRDNLGLPELPADQIKGEAITVGGAPGHLYDLTSKEPTFAGKSKARTTAAIIEKDDTLWFVKMDGEESVVAAQQDAFKNFLTSIRFESQVAGSDNDWPTPEGWTSRPPSQMVLASYTTDKGSAVSVSAFDGATGGLLANVNRWRGQMRQSPITDADLDKEVKTVDLSDGSKATAVDVTGTNPQTGKPGRLYGLIVTRGSKTWFYKLTGDPDAVGAEEQKLVEFAGTAH